MTYVVSFPIAKSGCFESCSQFPTGVFCSGSLQVKILNQLVSFFCTFSREGSLDGLEKILCAILSLFAFMWCCFFCHTRLKKRKLFVISSSFSVTLNVPAEQLQSLLFKKGCHVNGIEQHFPRWCCVVCFYSILRYAALNLLSKAWSFVNFFITERSFRVLLFAF